jgi:hypothetical protein
MGVHELSDTVQSTSYIAINAVLSIIFKKLGAF